MKRFKKLLSILAAVAVILGALPLSVSADRPDLDYPEILCDQEIVVTAENNGGSVIYKFFPQEDGIYKFYSYNNNCDTVGRIFDYNMSELAYDDDSGEDNNFSVLCKMSAETVYALKAEPTWGADEIEYSIKITKADFPVLTEEQPVNVALNIDNREYVKFTPEVGGWYHIYAYDASYDCHPTFTLCDDSLQALSGYNDHESIAFNFVAGKTYYIETRFRAYSGTEYGIYFVAVEKAVPASSLSITYSWGSPVDSITDYEGETCNLYAELQPQNAIPETISWSSDESDIASVDDDGTVHLNSAGTAKITATSQNGLSAEIPVQVKTPLLLTEDVPLKVTINDDNYERMKFIPKTDGWYSIYAYDMSNSNIPGFRLYDENLEWLDSGGNSLGFEFVAGKTYYIETYFRSYDGEYATYYVAAEKAVPASSIEITDGYKTIDSITGYEGDAYYLSAEFQPYNAIPETVSWSSDESDIASVYEDGTVHLNSVGTTKITATSKNGLSAEIPVEVKTPPVLTEDNPVKVTVNNNHTERMKFIPETDGWYYIYAYDISNNDTAGFHLYNENLEWLDGSWADSFKFEFVAGKTYYIWTYSYGSEDVTFSVAAEKAVPASSIEITDGYMPIDSITGYEGDFYHVSAELYPENAIPETVSWSSDGSDAASVDEYGTVYLNSVGTTVITATSQNGIKADCRVTVKPIPEIHLNERKTVNITESDQYCYYSFTPEKDGYYAFYSISDSDTYGYILDSEKYELARDDQGGENSNFKVKYFLNAGEIYFLRAEYYDSLETGSFEVCVEETVRATNLEIVSPPSDTGYIAEEPQIDYEGLKLKLTWSDGSVTYWSYDDDDWEINGERIYINLTDFENTGRVYIYCGDLQTFFEVHPVENPVARIEIVNPSVVGPLIENFDGNWENSYGDEYFKYTPSLSDLQIRIYYTDGTNKTASYYDYVDGYGFHSNDNQQEEHWTVGSDNRLEISYLGRSAYLSVTVIKNPVERIEIVNPSVVKPLIENADGYWDDWSADEEYFYYYKPDLSDLKIRIYYTNGTNKTVWFDDYDVNGSYVDGYYFYLYDNQEEERWTLGDDNYIVISYLGKSAYLPITVIENPVDYITIDSAPTREYIFGDSYYGWLYDDGEYGFSPYDFTGLVLTLHYKDGSTKTYTDADIDERNIDGHSFDIEYERFLHESDLGYIPVTFNYMGKSAEYTVLLKESPVSSIEIVKAPDITEYHCGFLPDLMGTQIKITYKDGKSKIVTIDESNIKYGFDASYFVQQVDIDGYTMILDNWYDDEIEVNYLGAHCLAKGIIQINYEDFSDVKVSNVSENGKGMAVTLLLPDGKNETFIINPFQLDNRELYNRDGIKVIDYDGYSKTSNGILFYSITSYYTYDRLDHYAIQFFGYGYDNVITVYPENTQPGDTNGDGAIDGADLVVLKKYLFAFAGDSAEFDFTDVNNDGATDIRDLIALKKLLINYIPSPNAETVINGDYAYGELAYDNKLSRANT